MSSTTMEGAEGLIVLDLDRDAPEFDVALTKARPWRASVATDPAYDTRALRRPEERRPDLPLDGSPVT